MTGQIKGLELAGKHRGIVEDNDDPLKLGRLKVRVQAAYAGESKERIPWAWPCFPYGGMPQMAQFAVPEIGAGVWIEFMWKDGWPNATYPVWVGTWLAKEETPEEVEGASEDAHFYKVLKTTSGHSLTFCDKPEEEFIRIRDKLGNTMEFNDKPGEDFVRIEDRHGSVIELKDGNIVIRAAANVLINCREEG